MKSIHKNVFYALMLTTLLAMLTGTASAAAITTAVDNSAGAVGYETSLALNASGNPVISYRDATNGDLKVAICNDTTCTAPILTTVDSAGNVGAYTSLALNAGGNPVISYYDATNSNLKVAVCNDAACTAPTLTTVDNIGNVGAYTSLVLNASGNPVISYYDVTNGDLKIAVCNDATCTAPTLTTVDNNAGNVGAYTSLVLNASGNPVISYYDVTNGDLKVAVCNDATCTASTLTTVDNIGDVGAYTSLALNASGNPVISYMDVANADLKVVVCGNATCSAGNTVTNVDSVGIVGQNISLVLNSNGNPVISYTDATNGDLKVAVCGNATCSAGNILTTVDSVGVVGAYTSLALNAIGNPVISYQDVTNGDLKLATVTPPTVASHTLQASYTGTGPSSFTVTFSENVNNPAGDTDTDDVTNPNNYKIINKGANGTVNTASCASAVGGDDSLITPSGVTYAPNTAIINIGSALPAGSYRLFVCGTTSITDAIGVPLNLGADFTFDFTVGAAAASSTTENTRASSLPKTGFAPGKVTTLPTQPATLAYANLGDLWLEIPSLNVKSAIVGVPQNADKTWDVSWLGNDTGWLNGTAFPTWTGNSVLTAHVVNASGVDGPFAALKTLKYGDQVIVHMGGVMYVYEVRETKLSRPYSTSWTFQSKQDAAYLTLVTCSGYNPLNESYLFRRVVRAVLVSVVNE